MRTMTKVAIGSAGGLAAVAIWAWGLLSENETLRREKQELIARCRERDEALSRKQSEIETIRSENAGLRSQLHALRNSTASKA